MSGAHSANTNLSLSSIYIMLLTKLTLVQHQLHWVSPIVRTSSVRNTAQSYDTPLTANFIRTQVFLVDTADLEWRRA